MNHAPSLLDKQFAKHSYGDLCRIAEKDPDPEKRKEAEAYIPVRRREEERMHGDFMSPCHAVWPTGSVRKIR